MYAVIISTITFTSNRFLVSQMAATLMKMHISTFQCAVHLLIYWWQQGIIKLLRNSILMLYG